MYCSTDDYRVRIHVYKITQWAHPYAIAQVGVVNTRRYTCVLGQPPPVLPSRLSTNVLLNVCSVALTFEHIFVKKVGVFLTESDRSARGLF